MRKMNRAKVKQYIKEVGIPEGWEFHKYMMPRRGQTILTHSGDTYECQCTGAIGFSVILKHKGD